MSIKIRKPFKFNRYILFEYWGGKPIRGILFKASTILSKKADCDERRDMDEINSLRKDIIDMVYHSSEGHIPSALCILDIIHVLYKKILRFDQDNPEWGGRDYFILSKGHGCAALYAVLADNGFFGKEELKTYCDFNGILGGHPDRNKVPGVEASTGSLGHGLPIGIGIALAMKILKRDNKVIVLIGDGESNEGTIWESAQIAKNLSLDNLIVIVDKNKSQAYSVDYDYKKIWSGFGWEAEEMDGHNHKEIEEKVRMLLDSSSKKPKVIVANTVKGKGVSIMENNPEWHHKSPDEETYRKIIEELK